MRETSCGHGFGLAADFGLGAALAGGMELAKSLSILSVLLAASSAVAEDRGRSAKQRFVVRIPQKVSFGSLPPLASFPANELASDDADSLQFFAETTGGLTIRFETTGVDAPPLQLDVVGNRAGGWRAHAADGGSNVAQAISNGAGWALLKLHSPSATTDAMPTITITIVANR